MITILTVFSNILQFIVGYIFYKIISCCLERKKPKIFFFIIWGGLSIVSTFAILAGDPVNITIVAILFLLINFLLFKGKPLIKLAMAVIIFSVNTYLFVVLFWYVFYYYSKKSLIKMKELLDNRTWTIMIIICLAPFAGIFTCVYFTPSETYKVWPCVIACIITSSCSIRLASNLADGIYADMEKKNLKLQKNYYEILEKNQTKIRELRHDMNNHLTIIGLLLKNKNNKEALEYFETLSVSLEAPNRRFCKNKVVNAVLNIKYNQLSELKTDIFFNISIDSVIIDNISLCSIFTNTLDNAIEAIRKIPDKTKRRMSLKARCSDSGYFSYEIINTKVNPIHQQKGRFLTDKNNSKHHGIGLSSIQSIVSRYGGTIDISYTDAEFKVIILIK